ncbi:MAG: hypothetical protein MR487_10905, partial [Lachnospiraceae bacterium]|nr:hypothetical protein [Lachnospiraceae bacterium]
TARSNTAAHSSIVPMLFSRFISLSLHLLHHRGIGSAGFHQHHHGGKILCQHLGDLFMREIAHTGGAQSTDAEGVNPNVLEQRFCVVFAQIVVFLKYIQAFIGNRTQVSVNIIKGLCFADGRYKNELVQLWFFLGKQNHLHTNLRIKQKIIIQQYTRTGHTVFWLFILAIYIVIVYFY